MRPETRPEWIVCSHCGKRRRSRRAFGVNGRWLCGVCSRDTALLRAFLDSQFQLLARDVYGTAFRLCNVLLGK